MFVYRVISVEDSLEGNDGEASQDGSINFLTSEMLDAVKRELTASQDCLQEAASSLEKINNKQGPKNIPLRLCQSLTMCMRGFVVSQQRVSV